MKPREYCCCAIPIVNTGIYTALITNLVSGILVGALAVATPSIVGASTPSFASWILAIICFVAAAVQFLAFIGVSREKPTLYRRYVTLHGLLITAAFSVAAAWIIMSAVRHSNAKTKCIDDFFSGDGTSSEGDTLCNIFSWVDVGIMGALWVILAILHGYLFIVVASYGKSQRRDHDQYDQVYDPTQPLNKDNIPLTNRNDPWDSRVSEEYLRTEDDGRKYNHVRQASSVSASDVLNEPYQEPKNALGNQDYGYPSTYPAYTDNVDNPAYPGYAYTQQPTPTPIASSYNPPHDPNLDRPTQAQSHPGES